MRRSAADSSWTPWRAAEFECRDTGIGEATAGRVGARVVRATARAETPTGNPDDELQFWFVLSGNASLLRPGHDRALLESGDSVALPARMPRGLRVEAAGCEFLEVTVPARPPD